MRVFDVDKGTITPDPVESIIPLIIESLMGENTLKILESREKIKDSLSDFDYLTKINILLVIVDGLLDDMSKEEKKAILKPFMKNIGLEIK